MIEEQKGYLTDQMWEKEWGHSITGMTMSRKVAVSWQRYTKERTE